MTVRMGNLISDSTLQIPLLSVVIPTLREYESLKILIPQIKNHLESIGLNFELIIVDDESEENTLRLIQTFSKNTNIKLIRHTDKIGLAKSALKGFSIASGEIVLLMDGDGSHNPKDITRIIEPILTSDKDISVGSRYLATSGIRQWSLPRILISKFAASLSKPVCKVSDPGSGFFAFRKNSVDLKKVRPLSWKIGLEIFSQKPNSIEETPIVFENRYAGESKFDLKAAGDFIFHLSAIYFDQVKKSFKMRGLKPFSRKDL